MKRKPRSELKSVRWHAEQDKLLKSYPALSEFMTAAVYEDGDEVRESPTVTLWASGGQWKCSVKDRAESLVMWLSAESLADLLRLLEQFVLEPEGPWRHDDMAHERNGKRVRKSS